MALINKSVLPEELLEIIENGELEWDGGVVISGIIYSINDVQIELTIKLDQSDESVQLWRIKVEGLRDERIIREWAEDIAVYDEHFLIDEQKDKTAELYVKNANININNLITNLYYHFENKYNGFIAFDTYINNPTNKKFLNNLDNGLIASGPKFILKDIATVLKEDKIETYFFNEQPAMIETNNLQTEDKTELFVLILGNSYFVAEKFSIIRI